MKVAERGLIWALMRAPEPGAAALAELDAEDLGGLAAREILRQAQSLQGFPTSSVPEALMQRLNSGEAEIVTGIARQAGAPADAADCVRTLRRWRYDRERADLQREIDRLRQAGGPGQLDEIVTLWERKKDLLHRIEALE